MRRTRNHRPGPRPRALRRSPCPSPTSPQTTVKAVGVRRDISVAERRSPAAGCPPLSRSCRDHRRPTSVRSPTRPVPRSARRILHWRAESKRTAGTDELTERSPALPLGRRRSRVAPRRRWSEDELQLRHSPRLSPVERRRSRPGDVLPNVRVRRRSRGGATMDINPSGAQLRITWGDQRATGVEGCGGIRCCEVGDRPVLDPYPVDSMYDAAHAAPLIPRPNRTSRLPSSGFLQWKPWEVRPRRRRGCGWGPCSPRRNCP